MRRQLVVIVLFSALTITGVTTLNLTSNDTILERGESLQLSCLTSGQFLKDFIKWLIPNGKELTTCFVGGMNITCNDLIDDYNSGYHVRADRNGSYIYINSLSREKDSGTWRCEYGNNETATINIYIYTTPGGVHLVHPLQPDKDLGVESLTLTCQTENCCFPAPTIAWYYTTSAGQTSLYQGSPGILSGSTTNCTQSEVSYTSTLQLNRGTTFMNNEPVTTKFVCGIEHPTLKGDIKYSQNSNNVIFAVNLTVVTLKDSSENNLPNTADVIDGTTVTLICVTSTSHPTAIVYWYIENSRITSGINNVIRIDNNGLEYVESRLNLTPSNTDHHNKRIYCQAYTFNSYDVLQSGKSLMFVKVQVKGITLYDSSSAVVSSNLPVVDGTTTTLHCETTPSRPAAIISWYKGDFVINNNVITTNWTRNGLDIIRSSLTFTPSNSDHGQYIYCQAYNIDPVDKVTSIRTTLQVTGAPIIPDISLDYKGYIGQYTIIEFDVYSNRDENLTVTAQHYNTSGLIQEGIIQKVLPDSLKMYSSPEPVFRALIAIFVRSEYDFGRYLVNVTNNVGSDLKIIRIEQKSIYPQSAVNSAPGGISVGGAVGIGVGGAVFGCIVTIITFTIRRQLNGSKSSCFSSKGKTEDATPTYSNTEMTSHPVKPIYEELSKGNVEHNMYDKITHSADGT